MVRPSLARNSPNAIRVTEKNRAFGAALPSGATIQHGDLFPKKAPVVLGEEVLGSHSKTLWYGPWVNGGKGVKNRYLGIKFKINGRFHYGWSYDRHDDVQGFHCHFDRLCLRDHRWQSDYRWKDKQPRCDGLPRESRSPRGRRVRDSCLACKAKCGDYPLNLRNAGRTDVRVWFLTINRHYTH
jgi:hypothetical protein